MNERYAFPMVEGLAPGKSISEAELVPTFYLAFGGAGRSLISRIKGILVDEVGDIPRGTQFLAVDTDPSDPDIIDHINDDEFLQITPPDTVELREHLEDKREYGLNSWVSRDLGRIEAIIDAGGEAPAPGAGGMRHYGRIIFFHNAEEIHDEMKLRTSMVMEAARGRGQARIVVAGSACGGTGTGCLIDAMFMQRHLIRKLKKDLGLEELSCTLDLMLFIGESMAVKYKSPESIAQFQANTYAFLKELDHFAIAAKKVAPEPAFRVSYPSIGLVESDPAGSSKDRMLCNTVFLMDSVRRFPDKWKPARSRVEDWDEYMEELALCAILTGYGVVGERFDGSIRGNPKDKVVNYWVQVGDNEPREQFPLYCAVGLAQVDFPAQKILDAIAVRLARPVASGLRGTVGGSIPEDDWPTLDSIWGEVEKALAASGVAVRGRNLLISDFLMTIDEEAPMPRLLQILEKFVEQSGVLDAEYLKGISIEKAIDLMGPEAAKIKDAVHEELRAMAIKGGLFSDQEGKSRSPLYLLVDRMQTEHDISHCSGFLGRLDKTVREAQVELEKKMKASPFITEVLTRDIYSNLKAPVEPTRGKKLLGIWEMNKAQREEEEENYEFWKSLIGKVRAEWAQYAAFILVDLLLQDLRNEIRFIEENETKGLDLFLAELQDHLEAWGRPPDVR
jgi:hypothetical protein